MSELTTNAKSLLDAAKRAPLAPSDEAIDRMEREILLAAGLTAAAATGAAAVKGASLWSAALGKILLSTTLLLVGGLVGAAIVYREPPAPPASRALPAIISEPVPSSVEVPIAPPPIIELPSLPPPEPPIKQPRTVKVPPKPQPVAAEAPPLPPPAMLPTARELAVLRAAMQHIDAEEWTQSVTLLDRHDAEFPSGLLRDESDVLRVLALCGLEQQSAAFDLASQLRARAPKSPALARLAASCVSP